MIYLNDMKILYLDVWEDDNTRDNFLNNILESKPDKVVFLGHQEFNYCDNVKDFEKVLEWHRINNKIYYVTTLGYPHENDPHHPNLKVYNWIDWYIKKIFATCVTHCFNNNDLNLNYYKKSIQYEQFNYFLTSLNYRAHRHRGLMIDLLAKHNLINNNAISWHNKISGIEHNFKYYNPQHILQLKNSFGPDWMYLPDQYFDSFVQLISESSDIISCITEKTVMALICHKPFVIAGPMGIHKKLSELGFKLFTELFDYSFDSEIDEEKRYDLIMKNLVELQHQYKIDNGRRLQKLILPKLIFNFQQVKKIACDFSTVPDVVLELRQFYIDSNINLNKYINSVFDILEQVQNSTFDNN